jgi:hypothetical protein
MNCVNNQLNIYHKKEAVSKVGSLFFIFRKSMAFFHKSVV